MMMYTVEKHADRSSRSGGTEVVVLVHQLPGPEIRLINATTHDSSVSSRWASQPWMDSEDTGPWSTRSLSAVSQRMQCDEEETMRN